MHAHTKPAAKLSAATNDTALTNDQRNHKIDRAMPVRATHTHTSPPRGTASLPGYNLCSTKASEHNHAHADERHASRLLAEPLEERAGRPREEGDYAAGAPRACILPDTTPRLTLEHACLEHASLPKSTRCPEHTLAPTPPSQRQRYPSPTTTPHPHTLSPLATLCVNVMFSQEPVEPNGRMPYVASCASPKPASLWSATHTSHAPTSCTPSHPHRSHIHPLTP